MHALLMILGGAVGAGLTFLLQRYGVSAVVASSLIGLAGAAVGFFLSDTALPAVIFAGSFVGMTALSVTSLPFILIAGAGSGILYLLMVAFNVFPGYGGRLGTIAFIATVLVLWLASFFWKK